MTDDCTELSKEAGNCLAKAFDDDFEAGCAATRAALANAEPASIGKHPLQVAPPAEGKPSNSKTRTITVQTPSFEEMREWILQQGQFSPCGKEFLQCLMLMTPPGNTEPALPTPPAKGEVAELSVVHATAPERIWLYINGANEYLPFTNEDDVIWSHNPIDSSDIPYIRADLLQQRHPAPVAVSERLPKASSKVLAYYVNELGMGRTICAIWVPAKSRSDDADLDDDDFLEYDEQTDEYYWPEGWYEAIENWDDLGYIKVNEGEIIYWQPLPDWHATALPLPAGEVRQ